MQPKGRGRGLELSPLPKTPDARSKQGLPAPIVVADEPATPPAQQYASNSTPQQVTPSVIHQYTMQSPTPSPIKHLATEDFERKYHVPKTQHNKEWGNKLRRFFCCFAPKAEAIDSKPYAAVSSTALPPPPPPPFTPPVSPKVFKKAVIGPKGRLDRPKKTLVLDLDETLVHSSFKPIPNPDYIIEVEIEGRMVDVYVLKRPWLDLFMETVAKKYEVIVFTASLSKYADPLLDLMDKAQLIRWRLFREACVLFEGNYVKDLNCECAVLAVRLLCKFCWGLLLRAGHSGQPVCCMHGFGTWHAPSPERTYCLFNFTRYRAAVHIFLIRLGVLGAALQRAGIYSINRHAVPGWRACTGPFGTLATLVAAPHTVSARLEPCAAAC